MNSETVAKQPLFSENTTLYNLIKDLEEQKKRAETESATIHHDMKELNNSLACLNGLAAIVQRTELDTDTAIGEILDLIPHAWQLPDETAARITLEGREFKTSNFIVETKWRFAADIRVEGEIKGLFEVFYLENKAADFAGMQMWENKDLIEAFAAGIGAVIERRLLIERLDRRMEMIRKNEDRIKHANARTSNVIGKLRSMKEQRDSTEHRMHWLLARVSSELRDMLVGVNNLAGKGLETACREIAEPFRQIKAEAEEAIRTTNRIYDYAHISHGQFRHNNTEFRLRDVVENAVDRFYDQARKQHVDIIVVIDPFVPDRVIGDGNRLSQVLTYLIENALIRSGDGEVVIRINVEVSAHMLPVFHFTIVDNGSGIAVESKDRLFDVCSEDTNSLARGNLYARLGTAISKHMVEILGGEIWVDERKDNAEGNEIHFTMWLDVVKKQHDIPDSDETSTLGGARILVADGSKTYREVYRLLLEYWGTEATIVSTGQEILDLVRSDNDSSSPYAAVIIDAELPDMDGYKVVEQLHHTDARQEIPPVIVTSTADWPPDEDHSRANGVAAALGKPIRQSELQEALTAVVSKKTSPAVSPVEDVEQSDSAVDDSSESGEESFDDENQLSLWDELSREEDQPEQRDATSRQEDESMPQNDAGREEDQPQPPDESPEEEDEVQDRKEPDLLEYHPRIQRTSTQDEDQPQIQDESPQVEDQPQIEDESPQEEDQPQIQDESIQAEDQSQIQDESLQEEDQPQIQDESIQAEDQSQIQDESPQEEDQPQIQDELPREEDQPPIQDESIREDDQPQDNEESSRRTILLYDNGKDERRELIVNSLRDRGYAVVTAATGCEIQEKIKSDEVDIAFIGTVMPDMYGIDIVNSIRGREKDTDSHLPLIAILPASGDFDRESGGLHVGFDDFIHEPIKADGIVEIIESHLPQPAVTEEPAQEQNQPIIMHFDRERALKVVDQDPVALTDLIEIFEDECSTHLGALDDSLAASDYGKVIDVSEKLHKAAAHIGAMRIAATSERMSELSLPDDIERASELTTTLREEFGEFRKIADAFARTTMT